VGFDEKNRPQGEGLKNLIFWHHYSKRARKLKDPPEGRFFHKLDFGSFIGLLVGLYKLVKTYS